MYLYYILYFSFSLLYILKFSYILFHKIISFNKDVSQSYFQYLVVKMFHVKHYLVVKFILKYNVSRETLYFNL